MPKITIITVIHNLIKNHREHTFKACVDSVYAQNKGQIEHLVIDGGSTDGSLQILEEYKSKGWIKYISEADNGIYDAMNKGIRLAQGEYVWFVNSDDYILPGSVSALLSREDFGKVDVYICGVNEHTEKGRIRITGADGTLLYEGNLEKIRGRGNSTWSLEKKPFEIKLSEKADLFGMGEAKTWILLANGFDETGIRSSIGLWLADEAGLAFTPRQEPVDLYCNGEYQGSYLLCEKVQARENRVEIGNGYLIERELKERWEVAVYTEGKAGFATGRGEYYLIDFPENPTPEQIEEIRSLVQEAEDAVFAADGIHPETGRSWDEYLDRDSFVRKYLLEEVTKNYDGGVTTGTGPNTFSPSRPWTRAEVVTLLRRALGLDCLASLCVIVMTVAFTLRVLAF